ncbi:PadR family transcriptional regulator [Stenotrophomonas terrae]|uniref:PadR family transcriptional regulator n=1 Tax=Stenotrophomonas terrae TaxID=405446 RepID=A0A0R0C5P2_9GAMM|nr:PadR family transcriptional regulator [Stenotrophomonas terrae]KRG65037.1 PadR family transcriptional regulator [Stenotrophomonas terrae]
MTPTEPRRRTTPRPLGRGDLRLLLLSLIGEQPRHGYELIQQISEMFVRVYTPSPGSVYPLLADFESQRWVSAEEDGGRKRYHITSLGQAQLKLRAEDVETARMRARHNSRVIARESLPAPLRDAMHQFTHALMLRKGEWQAPDVARIAALIAEATALVQQQSQEN